MKLYFSTIRIALPNTEVLTYWESGHPDEYDVQELFARSARYHTVAELLTEPRAGCGGGAEPLRSAGRL